MQKIAIIGAGIMGIQIAELFLRNGFDVLVFVRDKTKNSVSGMQNGNIKITQNLKDLKDCDLIIESIKEDLQEKQEIFKKMGNLNFDGIIASNTSSLLIKDISANCKNRQNILGMHFFNPVAKINLIEIAATDYVAKENIKKLADISIKIGKKPVIVKDTPGFLLNRILFAMLNEAANLIHNEVSTKEDIDKVMVTGALHPAGPLKIIDLIGIDVTVEILKNLKKQLNDDKYEPSPILLKMLQENKLGRKTKEGFYKY